MNELLEYQKMMGMVLSVASQLETILAAHKASPTITDPPAVVVTEAGKVTAAAKAAAKIINVELNKKL